MSTKYPNNKSFAIILSLSYQVDPAAAVLPIEEWRGVVISGDAAVDSTNKPLARYPEAGDPDAIVLGIVNSGAEEALAGDFPSASECHISVVESGTYLLSVADGETIATGDLVDLDANGQAVAATTGIVSTTWVCIEGVDAPPASGDYIKVKLH